MKPNENYVDRPLYGVNVLEVGHSVSVRYCGRLLAEMGARVVRINPHQAGYPKNATNAANTENETSSLTETFYGVWLDQFKETIARPSDDLIGSSRWDLVLLGPDVSEDTANQLSASLDSAGQNPTTVEISWFFPDGPYAQIPGSDEAVLALTGLAYGFGTPEGGPTLAQGHAPQIIAGANAAGLGVAALLADKANRPHHIAVEIFESTMCLTETVPAAFLTNPRAQSFRLGVNQFVPTYPCASYETSDGWVGVTCLTPAQWGAMCDEINRPDAAENPNYATAIKRLWHAQEIDDVLIPAIKERTTEEWVQVGLTRRIPITAMPRPGQLPTSTHWRERGTFRALASDDSNSSKAPWAPTLPFVIEPSHKSASPWLPDDEKLGPLSGLRVLDLSMGWAGPFATRTLGDLGADIVKIESQSHPDWWRGWETRKDANPPSTELESSFNAMNRNKRSVDIELDSPEGRQRIMQLVDQADVVINNFAVGVPKKMGIDPETLLERRPELIVVSMPAFGSEGPWSGVRAYGSTVEQASGLPFMNGYENWAPAIQHVAFGDPIGGIYGVLATLGALYGRQRNGGSAVDLAQVACLFELGTDGIIYEQLNSTYPRMGNRRPTLAPSCIVPAQGKDEWLVVAITSNTSWQALCGVLGRDDWANNTELASLEGRQLHADEIEAAIADWASRHSVLAAADALWQAGVSAAPVYPSHSRGTDPHLEATGYWQVLDRPNVGDHLSGGPAFRFDGQRIPARSSTPVLGSGTADVAADPNWGASSGQNVEG